MTIASIADLAAKLEAANKAYRDGAPIMSDSDYDQLEASLRAINPAHPLLQSLSDDEYGVEQALTIPMGSQQKALTLAEMASFYASTGEDEYFVSDKLDGMSAELTYVGGRFVQALTRGDGTMGANITAIVERIPSVPKTIPQDGKMVVRGEVMLTKSDLAELNRQRVAAGEKPYANVRNGAVALTKTLKNLEQARFLSFKAFDLKAVA